MPAVDVRPIGRGALSLGNLSAGLHGFRCFSIDVGGLGLGIALYGRRRPALTGVPGVRRLPLTRILGVRRLTRTGTPGAHAPRSLHLCR
ncbi:hypothetical protein, partial [Streptomyces sp. IBSBF 3352]|uniref:hypothetical protein n=1 Tax=Streptomyces sp. IBSBF 3352 TaxID=2903523 RepID=UPI002FDBD98D